MLKPRDQRAFEVFFLFKQFKKASGDPVSNTNYMAKIDKANIFFSVESVYQI